MAGAGAAGVGQSISRALQRDVRKGRRETERQKSSAEEGEVMPLGRFRLSNPDRPRAKRLHIGLSVLLYLFFAVFLIWPIIQIVAVGFRSKSGGFTFAYVFLIFRDHVLLRGLLNALLVAALTSIVALAISIPLAILSVRYEF